MKNILQKKFLVPVCAVVLFFGAATFASAHLIVKWPDGVGCTLIQVNPDGTSTGYAGTLVAGGCLVTANCSAVSCGTGSSGGSTGGGLSNVFNAFSSIFPVSAAAATK